MSETNTHTHTHHFKVYSPYLKGAGAASTEPQDCKVPLAEAHAFQPEWPSFSISSVILVKWTECLR